MIVLFGFGQNYDSNSVKTDIKCYLKVQEQSNIIAAQDSIISIQGAQINHDSVIVYFLNKDVLECTQIGNDLVKQNEAQIKKDNLRKTLLMWLVPIVVFETAFIFFIR